VTAVTAIGGIRTSAGTGDAAQDIDKEEEKPFELGDYFAGRIQARYDAQVTDASPSYCMNVPPRMVFHPWEGFGVGTAIARR
jgi:hypothetical protein